MGFELILTNVARHIQLESEEVAYFTSLLKTESIPRKGMLLKAGELCKNISFVCEGTVRAYYVDQEGKEATIMFGVTDWWITDMHWFVHQLPAMLTLEAVEKSVVMHLPKSSLDELYREVPKFERFFRIIFQNAYIREQLRTIQNLSLSAEERYANFMKKYPQVAKQVTQKQIASYLGITPEFLSVLRKKKT
jgi:CRP-like cAMP-binding protein